MGDPAVAASEPLGMACASVVAEAPLPSRPRLPFICPPRLVSPGAWALSGLLDWVCLWDSVPLPLDFRISCLRALHFSTETVFSMFSGPNSGSVVSDFISLV